MSKKFTAAMLCVALALIVVACSAASDGESTAPSTSTNGSDAITTAPGTSAPETSAPETSSPETTAPETTAPEEMGFQEIVLVDNEDICFKIMAVEDDSIWGYSLKVYIENRTDKGLMFSAGEVSVNGFMCDPFWADYVSAGKKSNSSISWFESTFVENGITEVEEITFTLRVYDDHDFTADDVLLETFTIHP